MARTPLRRLVLASLLTVSVTGALVGTAVPGSASKAATKTVYKGTWVFETGAVTGSLKRDVQLTDYTSTEWYDRVAATPGRGDTAVNIAGKACKPGTYFASGLSLYAEPTDWLQTVGIGDASTAPARVKIGCTGNDGVVHHFHWGNYVQNTDGTTPQTRNCVVLSRPSRTTISITADTGCLAQDEVVDNQGNTLSASTSSIPFSATLTFATL